MANDGGVVEAFAYSETLIALSNNNADLADSFLTGSKLKEEPKSHCYGKLHSPIS